MKKSILLALSLIPSLASAQEPVSVGRGSYAAYPPPYKARTADRDGFNASLVESKQLFLDESVTLPDGSRRPIPTNDWWTDLLNNRFSGALWSYPAMIHTADNGVTVDYPSYWNENGTEVKSRSRLRVGGRSFVATEATAVDWHDWDVVMRLPDASGEAMTVTLAHGIPFTWFEFSDNFTPVVAFSETPAFFDASGDIPLPSSASSIGIRLGDDLYGLWFPEGARLKIVDSQLVVDLAATPRRYAVVGLLSSADDLDSFDRYARSVPRSTRVSWSYDEASSLISTSWQVDAVSLDGRPDAPVMQGFLPHVYKHAASLGFSLDGPDFLCPRGQLKTAFADDGRFSYAYRFNGVLPYYPAPALHGSDTEFRPDVMKDLIDSYAASGTFGADTYWGGKGLVQMALNMTFAKETGNADAYDTSRRKLREILVDWLTYTPGENRYFFAYYPRWGSMVGFDVSYDSDAFNDHHFHYGYYMYAAALLCLEDPAFARDYGDMLRLVAKDYANYDRDDSRFPFLRTLDPWAGHSYAGGLGDPGNDNGNGQESSSEAMQSWGGLYLLGVALGDRQMRDAGIFGWMTESNAVAEYWFDRDQIHPDRPHNYDYTLYQSPYCTNLTSKGIGWWTWFSGDALWMHSIQWMPVSPCLSYLSKDLDFVKWDFEKMMSATAYDWFEKRGENDPLATQSVGNVVLCYMERYDPLGAAAIFDEAYDRNFSMARAIDTGHISYYAIHSHLTYGDIDFDIHADCPTASAYRRSDGSLTFVVYNPGPERDVTFRDVSGSTVGVVRAPSGGFTVFDSDPRPSAVDITSSRGLYILPGQQSALSAVVLDQYGASVDGRSFVWSVSDPALASVDADASLTVAPSAPLGSRFSVTASSGDLSASVVISVNDAPSLRGSINGLPSCVETGTTVEMSLDALDQYGEPFAGEVSWTVSLGDEVVADSPSFIPVRPGRYTVIASDGNGGSVSAAFTVTPPLPDLAVGRPATSSSEENVGSVTPSAVDGDSSTRWGSAHSDDQWIYVDLGADCYVTRVVIDWEAAFAADYEICIAPDGVDMDSFNAAYAAGPALVKVPADWSCTVAVSGVAAPGKKETVVGATGRYVMMRGLRRGSPYGYSLYSFNVHGLPADAASTDVVGIDISAPAVIDQGATATLDARAVTLGGDMIPVSAVDWTCSVDALFQGNDFTPLGYGLATLSAATHEGYTSSVSVLVNEVERLASLDISPASWQMIVRDRVVISASGLNQYGGLFDIAGSAIEVTVTDGEGNPVDPAVAFYDPATSLFSASAVGVYTVAFGNLGSAVITVADVADTNLALGKPAVATSSNGLNIAANAVDGDPLSRWESVHRLDGEMLTVDLLSTFLVNRVSILWEGAYADTYRIMTSVDGEHWATVASRDDGHGNREETRFSDVPARYVRLVADSRFIADYGVSLFEFEVYGSSRYDLDLSDSRSPEMTSCNVSAADDSVAVKASATDSSDVIFFSFMLLDADGNIVDSTSAVARSADEVSASLSGMAHGRQYTVVVTAADPMGNETSETAILTADIDIQGKNLALRRPVTASSHENEGLRAHQAVDGDYNTRWGSLFNDNEWIEVELADIYEIHQIHLYCNDPATAATFEIQASVDGNEYFPLGDTHRWTDTTFDGKGTGVQLDFRSPLTRAAAPEARYIRFISRSRKTQYGTSVGELEVYGNYGDSFTTGTGPVIDTDPTRVSVYTTTGILLRHNVDPATATRDLPPGLYILANPTTDSNQPRGFPKTAARICPSF